MIPLWKLKRELKRLHRNVAGWPADFLSYCFGPAYYDFFLSRYTTGRTGLQPASSRCAIYLIFPKQGILPSHLRSLAYLADKGICTIVVSNFPLSDADRDKVLKLCHHCIERPNYGYDFGGYRDGVLYSAKNLPDLTQMILINDSVWFPVVDGSDWLNEVDALDVDIAGAASHYAMPRVDPEHFDDFEFDYSTKRNSFHYCSFAISFGKEAISHPQFLKFWTKFPLTNKKQRTVRRGEIGLTKWALKNGLSHAETSCINQLEQRLDGLDVARLKEVARSTIIMDDDALKKAKSSLISRLNDASRDEIKRFVLTVVARQGASYSLAFFNTLELGYPFLKKSPVRLDQESAQITFDILDRLNTPAAREIRDEILQMPGAHQVASQPDKPKSSFV